MDRLDLLECAQIQFTIYIKTNRKILAIRLSVITISLIFMIRLSLLKFKI